MLGVVRYPYMPTDVDRCIQQVAAEMGRGETFNKAPVGVYFGSPGVEVDDPYFGGVGPRRTGCISCGNCNIGCGHNAKNKLTTNYLYLAEKLGAQIHELQEVYDLVPLEGGGFEVHARHPGWVQRATRMQRHTYTAEQVIVAAHAYGSSKLLLHMQHKGRLPNLSGELGKRARTNSEQLLALTRTHEQWSRDPEKIHITPGSVAITSGVWPDAVTSIEPTIWGVGSDVFAFLVTYHQHGEQKHPTLSWLKQLATHPGQVLGLSDPRHWSERSVIMLCMQTTDTSIELYWHDGLLRSRHGSGAAPPVHIPIVEDFVDRVAKKMDASEGAVLFEVINRNASAHFVGGIPIGDNSQRGAVDPYLRAFGQPGLHVMDGSVMPANPGVNPSLMITALAERAMSLWPNKGEADKRPPLGSGYERVRPIMPRRPVVPAGAPGELRLDAKKSDVIPDYPY
jgi:cholesterol oxidase